MCGEGTQTYFGVMTAIASRRHRIVFALLVTAFSITLAEVSIGNQPYGLIFPVMWVLLVPVYGLQAILLATFVFRRNPQPTFLTVWLAGVVFGLYEFFITAVLWGEAEWGTGAGFAGVAWGETIVIALFYHPFMSFIFPLAIVESMMVKRPHIAGLLSRWVREPGRKTITLIIVLLALAPVGLTRFAPAIVHIPLSLVLTVLVLRWLSKKVPSKVETFAELLPSRREWWIYFSIVAATFAIVGSLIVWYHQITAGQIFAALTLYTVAVVLLLSNMRHRAATKPGFAPHLVTKRRVASFLLLAVALSAGATAVVVVKGVAAVIGIVVIWVFGALLGLFLLARALRSAVRRRQVEVAAEEPMPVAT